MLQRGTSGHRLSETSQAQKDKHCKILPISGTGVVQLRETGSGMVAARVWGDRGLGSCLMGRVSHLQDEEFWKSDAECECT